MDSCDAMLAALDQFPGTLIMVTHNEMFLHALAQKLVVFQDDGVSVFWGGYQEFLDQGGWQTESAARRAKRAAPSRMTAPAADAEAPNGAKADRKALKRLRSEWVTERARVLKPLEKRIAMAEKTIEDREVEMGLSQRCHGGGLPAGRRRTHPRSVPVPARLPADHRRGLRRSGSRHG